MENTQRCKRFATASTFTQVAVLPWRYDVEMGTKWPFRDSEETFSIFKSSCHLLLPVKPLIGSGNPVKCFAQGCNKRICWSIPTLTLLTV